MHFTNAKPFQFALKILNELPDQPLTSTVEHQEPFSVVWACWQMHVTPELWRQRQQDPEFRTSLACRVKYCLKNKIDKQKACCTTNSQK